MYSENCDTKILTLNKTEVFTLSCPNIKIDVHPNSVNMDTSVLLYRTSPTVACVQDFFY